MLSATDFLPCFIRLFMNFETIRSPNFGSGLISRLAALWRRDMAWRSWWLRCAPGSLRPLGAVLRAALAAVADTLGVEHAADDVVAHPGQVLHPAAADHHHRVFLEVVA